MLVAQPEKQKSANFNKEFVEIAQDCKRKYSAGGKKKKNLHWWRKLRAGVGDEIMGRTLFHNNNNNSAEMQEMNEKSCILINISPFFMLI